MSIEDLKKNGMRPHLTGALDRAEDIGHDGRLVFAMVARHFLSEEEPIGYLRKDRDFSEEQARSLYHQVQSRGYNPPRRETILDWQKEQEFPICATPEDPDAANVYKDLPFPDRVYENISGYHEKKAESEEHPER
ncbi:MAG: hypothetical protein M3S32_04760 [Acidobacteriota bacterium]|nr:hypothetical protein [Acidobacteriota bacterium]